MSKEEKKELMQKIV